jgi:pimeloyl-ACP methyl ester carboxylesterase
VVAGIPIFGQLASALADAGFLVLRYDKRGIGQSGGRAESATLQDYAEDIRAVVRYLSDRKDVDKKRINVVGHSEGAWTTVLAASREDDIAKAVLVAAPASTGAELVLAQQRDVLERSSMPDADKQAKVELQKKIQAAALGGGTWEGVPPELRKQAETPWFASFLAFDPAKVLPRVPQPLLIVQGKLDRQVAPENAARLAELANARKKRPPTEVVLLDGINHLLVPATTGELEEYASLTGREIDPRVAETIVTWLRK